MKVMITGVTGQDGFYLSETLLKRGCTVVGTSRNISDALSENLLSLKEYRTFQFQMLDLYDPKSVLSFIQAHKPDAICHLASMSSVGKSFKFPVETVNSCTVPTLYLLEAIKQVQPSIKMIHTASSECFGDQITPITEESVFAPASPYGVGKTSAAQLVQLYARAYSLAVANVYLFNHESHLRGDDFVVKKLIRHAFTCKHDAPTQLRYGNLQVERDWGSARLYMEYLVEILFDDLSTDYVIGSGIRHRLEDFAEHIFAYFGLSKDKLVISDQSLFRPAELRGSVADPGKFIKRFGLIPATDLRDLAHGICREYEDTMLKKGT